MEKVRPWCGQPSDRGRLKNRNRNSRYSYVIERPVDNACELAASVRQQLLTLPLDVRHSLVDDQLRAVRIF